MDKIDIEGFLGYLKQRVSRNTQEAYSFAILRWSIWLNGREPSEELAQEYIDFLIKKGYANNSVLIKANAIKRYFKWKRTPIILDCPRMEFGNICYLNKDQLASFISVCSNPLEKVLVYLLMDTGCRKSELLELKLSDIDWNNSIITVTRKGGRIGRVNLSDKGLGALEEWLKIRKFNSKKVFNGLSSYEAWKIIHRIGRRINIRAFPHIFRHTRAVQLLQGGADMHTVQLHLGHQRIGTTMDIYGRILPEDYKNKLIPW